MTSAALLSWQACQTGVGARRRAGTSQTARGHPPVSPPSSVVFASHSPRQSSIWLFFSHLIAHMETKSNFRWNGASSETRTDETWLRRGDTQLPQRWKRTGSKRRTVRHILDLQSLQSCPTCNDPPGQGGETGVAFTHLSHIWVVAFIHHLLVLTVLTKACSDQATCSMFKIRFRKVWLLASSRVSPWRKEKQVLTKPEERTACGRQERTDRPLYQHREARICLLAAIVMVFVDLLWQQRHVF